LTVGCDGKVFVGFVIDFGQLDTVAEKRVNSIYGVFIYEVPGCGVSLNDAPFGNFTAVDAG